MSEWRMAAPYLAFLLGAAAGVVVPYLRKYLEEGAPFDGKKVVGKVIAALIGLALMPTFGEMLAKIGALGWSAAFLLGLGATFVGHETQSAPKAVRAWQAARAGKGDE